MAINVTKSRGDDTGDILNTSLRGNAIKGALMGRCTLLCHVLNQCIAFYIHH